MNVVNFRNIRFEFWRNSQCLKYQVPLCPLIMNDNALTEAPCTVAQEGRREMAILGAKNSNVKSMNIYRMSERGTEDCTSTEMKTCRKYIPIGAFLYALTLQWVRPDTMCLGKGSNRQCSGGYDMDTCGIRSAQAGKYSAPRACYRWRISDDHYTAKSSSPFWTAYLPFEARLSNGTKSSTVRAPVSQKLSSRSRALVETTRINLSFGIIGICPGGHLNEALA